MSAFTEYEPTTGRTLPVVLLLDVSGSMDSEDKIEVLNDSVLEMIEELRQVDAGVGALTMSLVAFGGQSARVLHAHQPIAEVAFQRMKANGPTPLGHAFEVAKDLIEDRAALPNRSYRPTIALVSDGIPTDKDWAQRLDELISSERGQKATRFALAVGSDADREMLSKFTGGSPPHEAGEAAEIRKFLRFVTTKVTESTRTARVPDVPEAEADSPESRRRLTDDDAF